MTGSISDLDKEALARTAARMSVLVKTPERIERICCKQIRDSGRGSQWGTAGGRMM